MTPWQQRADALTRRMADDMKLRNLAQKTIDAYTYHVGYHAFAVGVRRSRRKLCFMVQTAEGV